MTSRNINVVLIPVRGGLKGIFKKNIKSMVGQPLCAWILKAAFNALQIIKCMFQPTAERLQALRWVLRKLNKPYKKYLYKNKQTDTLITFIKQGSCRLIM